MKKYFLLPHCYAKTGLCLMVLFLIMFGIDLAGAAPKIKVPMPYIVNEIIGETHGSEYYLPRICIWRYGCSAFSFRCCLSP